MEVVPFTLEDQEETAAFMRDIYQEMGWPEQPGDGLNDLAHFFHLPHDGFLLLIKENGKVVGTGGCVKLTATDLLLKRFYIAKEKRGSGIARKLLNKLLEESKQYGRSRIVIDVSKKNPRAIRFYEKNGFIQYDQEPMAGWAESRYHNTHVFYFLKI